MTAIIRIRAQAESRTIEMTVVLTAASTSLELTAVRDHHVSPAALIGVKKRVTFRPSSLVVSTRNGCFFAMFVCIRESSD